VKLRIWRSRHLLIAILAVVTLVVPVVSSEAAAATVLRVPLNYPTIQAAIDAAAPGDTVLVSPGTYVERLDFRAKPITVESTDGPATTIIDGDRSGSVARIVAGQGQTPVLRGFTIRNGTDTGLVGGGGVYTSGGPALIEGNWVVDNFSCNGGGIKAEFSSATIRDNLIADNRHPVCGGGLGGGGVLVAGAGTVQVLNNVIRGNVSDRDGGGLSLWAAGTPTISGNVITGNSMDIGVGGGISLVNQSDAVITNNFIVGNSAIYGGGIAWLVPSGPPGPTVVNNTIASNLALRATAVLADGFDAATRLTNNILYGSGPETVVECDAFNDLNPPVITFNDVFNAGSGPEYGGICTDQTGLNGNISADPLFINAAAGNFHVQARSPVVDAGSNDGAPASDIDGDPRPLDGDGDGVAVVDIGADETPAGDTIPPAITCTATPSILRPPTHELRQVSVSISASDHSGSVGVTLISVTSNQADSGLGRTDIPNDIQDWTIGTDDRSGLLRAERFRSPRVYTLTYQAEDQAGNTATCQTTVTTP
jgi:serine protease